MGVPRIGRKFGNTEIQGDTTGVIEQEVEKVPMLDEAAEVLAAYLPEDSRRDIMEASKYINVPLWQMLLGYAVRCHDSALTYSPFLLSAWEHKSRPDRERPCEGCHGPFQSKFPDARFCCERCAFGKLIELGHSDECPLG